MSQAEKSTVSKPKEDLINEILEISNTKNIKIQANEENLKPNENERKEKGLVRRKRERSRHNSLENKFSGQKFEHYGKIKNERDAYKRRPMSGGKDKPFMMRNEKSEFMKDSKKNSFRKDNEGNNCWVCPNKMCGEFKNKIFNSKCYKCNKPKSDKAKLDFYDFKRPSIQEIKDKLVSRSLHYKSEKFEKPKTLTYEERQRPREGLKMREKYSKKAEEILDSKPLNTNLALKNCNDYLSMPYQIMNKTPQTNVIFSEPIYSKYNYLQISNAIKFLDEVDKKGQDAMETLNKLI